jgi:hypothetical protein
MALSGKGALNILSKRMFEFKLMMVAGTTLLVRQGKRLYSRSTVISQIWCVWSRTWVLLFESASKNKSEKIKTKKKRNPETRQ